MSVFRSRAISNAAYYGLVPLAAAVSVYRLCNDPSETIGSKRAKFGYDAAFMLPTLMFEAAKIGAESYALYRLAALF